MNLRIKNNRIMVNFLERDREAFWRDGCFILRDFVDEQRCIEFREIAEHHLVNQLAPIEYEADVQYPGAPENRDAEGGKTPRRLLQAISRHSKFRCWAQSDQLVSILEKLFRSADLSLSQTHHNCIMTKQPGYSSETLWHQDNRYWSFEEENLISVWLALGDEDIENGCLRVIKGSHREQLDPERFDAEQFLRTEMPSNKKLVDQSVPLELSVGDALFFHSRLLHAAGRNLTDKPKLSLVFTYHTKENQPIQNSRSAKLPEIFLSSRLFDSKKTGP